MSVSGVTKNELQRLRERSRLAAARNVWSADHSAGRATWRRRIGELMTENDDLQLLELLGAAGERDELQQASHGECRALTRASATSDLEGTKARDSMDTPEF
jgi:hypothetical protein